MKTAKVKSVIPKRLLQKLLVDNYHYHLGAFAFLYSDSNGVVTTLGLTLTPGAVVTLNVNVTLFFALRVNTGQ